MPTSTTPRTTYRWDSLDRLLDVRLPDGARVRHKHTFSETRSWDAENHESYIARDLDDRIVRSVQVLGSTELPTTYRYREFDLIDRIADPKGNLIELDYDPRGRRTRLRDPDSGTTAFSLQRLRRAAAKGRRAQPRHAIRSAMSLGRVVKITDADGVTELVWDASTPRNRQAFRDDEPGWNAAAVPL